MKKLACLMAFIVVACAGCTLDSAPDRGVCGNNSDLGDKNAGDCQCTAPNDDYNIDSINMNDVDAVKFNFCEYFVEKAKSNERYYCEDYKCNKMECPKGFIANDNNSKCIKGCDPDTEIADGNGCKCDDSKGYIGTSGACTYNGLLCDANKEVADSDGCKCDASKGYVGTAGTCIWCDLDKEIIKDNSCVCDESKGYVLVGDSCVKKAECDAEKEIYNSTTNQCDCNEEASYYKDDAGNCIKKCGENEGLYNGKCYKVNDELQFGRYPQSSSDAEPEPIDWIVLEASANDLFILSKYGLDAKVYNKEWEDITWAESTIRSWLNGYDASKNKDKQDYSKNAGDSFIGTAFSGDEIEMIKVVSIENPNAPWNGTKGGNTTTDKVFLLSYDEANSKYFESDDKRIARATPYAVSNNAHQEAENCLANNQYCATYWWLRTPGSNSKKAGIIGGKGIPFGEGSVNMKDYSLRPALHLKLNVDENSCS